MNEKYVKVLLKALRPYGAFLWYKSQHNSKYIKFKDIRVGSIRIANHPSKEKYTYKYDVLITSDREQQDMEDDIDYVYHSIIDTINSLPWFDPTKYVVWDEYRRDWLELESEKEYREHVLRNKPKYNPERRFK